MFLFIFCDVLFELLMFREYIYCFLLITFLFICFISCRAIKGERGESGALNRQEHYRPSVNAW